METKAVRDSRDSRGTLAGRARDGAAGVTGRALGVVLAGVSRARPADKPMHPRGVVLTGVLRRLGATSGPTGSPFLDEDGRDEVLVRFSRSLGLPAPWPDVDGLAVRVPTPAGPCAHADLLFSGSGRGPLTRYALAPTTRERRGFLGTLLPYRTSTGSVHLGAQPVDAGARQWRLLWARPRSPWTPFAHLELTDEPGRDLDLSFDAVAGGPPGLDVPEWHRRVRAPSYAAARRHRAGLSRG